MSSCFLFSEFFELIMFLLLDSNKRIVDDIMVNVFICNLYDEQDADQKSRYELKKHFGIPSDYSFFLLSFSM